MQPQPPARQRSMKGTFRRKKGKKPEAEHKCRKPGNVERANQKRAKLGRAFKPNNKSLCHDLGAGW